MADNYFCLDIDEKFTKVVDARVNGEFLDIMALGKTETPESFYTSNLEKTVEDEVAQIKKLVETLNITKKNVNVIIPDSLTYSQIISMPLLNEKELITAIKYQADQFIPMPIEETNIDIEVIEENQKEKKVLLLIVAAPKKVIERIQTTVELAGLNPESIENELSSNSRFINAFNKSILNQYKVSKDRGIVIVNFDTNSSSLAYFSPEQLIIKENHHLSIGYNLFLKEAQVNTDSDIKKTEEILKSYDEKNPSPYPIEKIVEPLIKELANELKIFTSKYTPSSILFINKIFLFPSLITSLSKELSIPVNILNSYPMINKSQLIETYKNELPIFLPAISGNLR
ncbi:MAG: Type IV pilus biogenesis ATPase PilM [Candidatus Roizmanbacteria bacterium GW2011_GWC2_34_23]|uniref:Type IV pilus biogenesis ATPase PilM n=1 Tax=Candidatus Roizmanbacteria bacterium GW2011_GWC2_34_23 TaxID=1618484 RepID=A0A0G0ATR8_9BACT|nr:MAG: Type IV pilus biogenesis ATPase PilM [Candidatus Roizmanbacteria bacterium GW2011_GWC2_34_23]